MRPPWLGGSVARVCEVSAPYFLISFFKPFFLSMSAMVCGLLIVLLIVLLVDDYADIAGAWAVVSQSVFSVGDVTLSNTSTEDLYIWNIY